MYFLTSLISGIAQKIWFVSTFLTSPFRTVGYQLSTLRRVNPFTQAMYGFRSLGGQLRYLLRMPGQIIPVPRRFSAPFKDMGESLRFWDRDKGEIRKRIKAGQTAQFSQIHLTNPASGERTILHIGNIIGRSAAEITLEQAGQKPLHLRFSQVDPDVYKAHIVLTPLSGDAIKVDGQETTGDAPIHNNSVIVADGQEYVCNLFAWDRTPVVTRVDAGWATTVGPVRDHNEDALGIYQHPNAYMFVVADGVGGGRDGDRFSEFAVQYLLAVFNKNIVYNLNWHDIFAKAFRYINTEVRNFLGRSAFPGGTTLTALVIKGWDAYVAHVGDTRLYLWHKDTLTQLTVDHSRKVEVSVDTRHAAEADGPLPTREVLEKAIGKNDRIEPDLFTVRLQPGDKLLLCTDGVINNVSLEEVVWLLRSVHISQVPDGLIRLALERNTSDNASAIAIDVLREPFIHDTWEAKPDERMYVGYDPLWSLRLRKPQDPQTEHPEVARAGCSVVFTVALAGLILYGLARLIGGSSSGATPLATEPPTATPTLTATTAPPTLTLPDTDTPSPTPSPTLSPTATGTPTPTYTPSPPPAPTSTLRASSSSALADAPDGLVLGGYFTEWEITS